MEKDGVLAIVTGTDDISKYGETCYNINRVRLNRIRRAFDHVLACAGNTPTCAVQK